MTSIARKNRMIAAAVFLLTVGLSIPVVAEEPADLTAKQVVEKLQQFYAGIDEYKVTFVQTTKHKMFSGRLQRAYGTLMYKKGGLMRWEYNRPEPKLFVYDGKVLWVYEPEVPQIFKGTADAERLRRALAFLTGEGRILDQYKVRRVDAKKCGFEQGIVLKLYPKDKKSAFNHVELYINPGDFRVERSVVVDHEKNRNRLDFTKPLTNSGLSADLFKFIPPPGVPVMQADQPTTPK